MPSNRPIFILGEARGELEARIDSCFVGPSGAELLRMLREAKVIDFDATDRDLLNHYYNTQNPSAIDDIWKRHPELYRSNVFQLHPPKNDLAFFCGDRKTALPGYPALIKSKYCRAEFEPELDRLANEIMDTNPNLIICLGNTPLWAMTGQTGISKIRGTTLLSTHTAVDFKILPTYHPAAVLRQWELRVTTVMDLMKAKREARTDEIIRPFREIWIEPTIDDIIEFFRTYCRSCRILSIDIETSGNRITCIGFAPSSDRAIVIPFDDERAKDGNYWPDAKSEKRVWSLIREILSDRTIRKLFQNGMYDIAFLWRGYGIATYGAAEDTMLLSHALQPESLKGLGYLGSVYSDEGSWKHMRKKHETIKKDD